jgi:hypothetical protein
MRLLTGMTAVIDCQYWDKLYPLDNSQYTCIPLFFSCFHPVCIVNCWNYKHEWSRKKCLVCHILCWKVVQMQTGIWIPHSIVVRLDWSPSPFRTLLGLMTCQTETWLGVRKWHGLDSHFRLAEHRLGSRWSSVGLRFVLHSTKAKLTTSLLNSKQYYNAWTWKWRSHANHIFAA